MNKKELLQTLHNLYEKTSQLHYDIINCNDITCEQNKDLIDNISEVEDIFRCMICEIE